MSATCFAVLAAIKLATAAVRTRAALSLVEIVVLHGPPVMQMALSAIQPRI